MRPHPAVAVLFCAVLLGGCTTEPAPDTSPSPAPVTSVPPTFVPTLPPDGLDPSRKAEAEAALPAVEAPAAVWRGVDRTSGAVHEDDAVTGPLALQATCVGDGETVRLVLRAGTAQKETTMRCGTTSTRTTLRITAASPGVYAEASGPPQADGVMVWQLVRT